jgi:hypothetical protein
MNDVVGLPLDVLRKRVWAREAGHPQAHPTHSALHQQRRQQRWVLGLAGHVLLFFYGNGKVALMGRRAHRVSPRQFLFPLEIFEKRREALQRFELVRIDGQEMARLVLQTIVSREKDKRARVRRLDDDVGNHHFQLFDASGRRGLCHHGHVAMLQENVRIVRTFGSFGRSNRAGHAVVRGRSIQ